MCPIVHLDEAKIARLPSGRQTEDFMVALAKRGGRFSRNGMARQGPQYMRWGNTSPPGDAFLKKK